MKRNLVKLSKFLALILRHQPERFALEMDDEGWVLLSEVMEILRGLPNLRWATRADVMAIVEGGSGDGSTEPSSRARDEGLAKVAKRRFQVQEGRIRACYGHSFAQRIFYDPCTPPSLLYHGTFPEVLEAIRHEGLKPMERQYVHLSPDRETAARVGVRHSDQPVVLTIRAAEAHAAGVEFYQADEAVYLARYIPPEFLDS